MVSATFVLLASNLLASSVMFGWQPMSDGSAKVEYLIQLEPELVARLQEGQTIPITSDIPEDIGPIGRIRIVVGSEALPRQKLVTRLKPIRPWPKRLSREGVVEAQYTTPTAQASGGSRYGAPAASRSQILPPGGGTAPAFNRVASNPLGRALQQGAQEAKNLASEVKQQILPPSEQLFGNGAGAGGAGQGVKNAFNDAAGRIQQGLQQGLQQGIGRGVRQAADQAEQQVRSTVDGLGQRAQEAVGQFGRTQGTQRSILNDAKNTGARTILPPSSSGHSSSGRGLADRGAITPGRQRIDEPVNQQQRQQQRQPQRETWPRGNAAPPSSFARSPTGQSDPSRSNPSSRPGDFNAPWPPIVRNSDSGTQAGDPAGRYGQGSLPPSQPASWPKGQDSFDLANRSRDNSVPSSVPSIGRSQQPTYEPGSDWSGGPEFPATVSREATGLQVAGPSWDSPSSPQIRRGDLPRGGQQAPMRQQGMGGLPSLGSGPQDFGRNRQDTNATSYSDTNSKGVFPLLLSWVLLSGSGAGNLYLFWSYLDVRSKYQGVVHGSSGRRSRYDD